MEVDYLYDSLDRIKEVHYPEQYGPLGGARKIVAHAYDTASRLTGMTYGGSQQAGNIVYNAADQTTQIKIGTAGTYQVTEDYTFDPQTGLLTNQKATKNGSLFIDLSYNYARSNSVGTLTGKTGHLTKITDNLNTQKNREYEFDVLGRLTKAKGGPTGNLWDQTYTYDRWGNRLNVAKNGTAAGGGTMPLDGIPNLAYDNATNRITTTGYQYDVNGNMIRSLAEDGSTWIKYEYDAANRLNIIRKDDTNQTQLERFQYDSTNARVQSHDPALDRYKTFLNAGGTTLAEFTEFAVGDPTWTKSYTYLGGSQLATITPVSGSENVEFNHPDRLGTKTVTNQSAGTSSEQATLPFGRPLDAESTIQTNNKRFTSYDRSEKTELDYAVNRTYDSKLGRFTQVDPVGMQATSLMSPQTLNMYSYCGNDPVNYTDPSGLFFGRFFRWLGRLLSGLSRSRVARRIATKFIVNFALSGGNFGVAIRSVIPDILQSTGIFPDPRSTVPWHPGSRLPISLGTSSLSKYIIYNLLQTANDELIHCLPGVAAQIGAMLVKDLASRRGGVNTDTANEHAFVAYEDNAGKIQVTQIAVGTRDSVSVSPPRNAKQLAFFHTHGAVASGDFRGLRPSEEDISNANANGLIYYVYAPPGRSGYIYNPKNPKEIDKSGKPKKSNRIIPIPKCPKVAKN